MPSGNDMKGLTVFISDIRAAKSREAEQKRINKELANIRTKFRSEKGIDGYQKKKYVCKLLYMYLLGIDIDFGHLEAVNLISSNKYTEKSIGYCFISVLLNEKSELSRLLIQSIKKDLANRNEIFVCLGLNCISNIGGKEMAEALSNDVMKLLVSSDSTSFVKKKAALCLLRLYRKFPEVLPMGEWSARIITLLDDPDTGVVLAVLSLLLPIVNVRPEEYVPVVEKVINLLHQMVIRETTPAEYVYYKIPHPWLQVKILRLLHLYHPVRGDPTGDKLYECLGKILSATEPTKSTQRNNARNAVMYEAMSLIIHLSDSSDDELIQLSSNIIGRLVSDRSTNQRYMALEMMSRLAEFSSNMQSVGLAKHQERVIASLRQEKDISVRRRALDLLYNMCDNENYKAVIHELLEYLEVAVFGIREEMVLKIAILSEKFASDYSWYVDVILNLIRMAGDYVSDEVWHRVIQIVTNREEVQDYATKTVFEALQSPSCHETMVKVGGYILGEFGHLIANDPQAVPIAQLELLHSKFPTSSISTKVMLLSTYVKFVNLFPEIKPVVQDLLKSDTLSRNGDVELQQRAIEYLRLCGSPDELLQMVLEEMPAYPERESSILAKLKKREDYITDKTWRVESRNEIKGEDNLPSEVYQNGDEPVENGDGEALPGIAFANEGIPEPTTGSHRWFKAFTFQNDGVLYESDELQVGVKSQYKGNLARIGLYFGNKTNMPFDTISTRIYVGQLSSKLKIQTQLPPETVGPKSQAQQLINVECLDDFTEAPVIQIIFENEGRDFQIFLKIPILICKFMSGFELDQATFFDRWKALEGEGLESQVVFQASGPIVLATIKTKLQGIAFQWLDNVDPNPHNFVGSGVIESKSGKIGCLVRLEPNLEAKMYRVTVRASVPSVAAKVSQLLREQF
eukprot:Nk52_evm105s224 gene=Nk52_evmTU105s224